MTLPLADAYTPVPQPTPKSVPSCSLYTCCVGWNRMPYGEVIGAADRSGRDNVEPPSPPAEPPPPPPPERRGVPPDEPPDDLRCLAALRASFWASADNLRFNRARSSSSAWSLRASAA